MRFRIKQLRFLFEIRLQFSNRFHLFFDHVELVLLIRFQGSELGVVIAFELIDNLFDHFDLGAFALIGIQFERIIQQVVNVDWVCVQGSFQFFQLALLIHDLPVDLLHALNVTVHLHVLACTTIVIILFTNLGSESAFGELQVRLSLALITLGRRVGLGLSSITQTFFLSITFSKLRRGQSNSIIS